MSIPKPQTSLFSKNVLLILMSGGFFGVVILATLIGQRWGYGYFIDELYYIACAKRLAFGYVDHPPLSPLLLRLMLATVGDSLLAIRVLPALAGAGSLFLTGLMARELGAGKFGQCLAAIALAISPVFLVMYGFYSMNAFEILLWTACGYLIILLIKRDQPRLWLWVGLLCGLGLLNKHTLGVYIVSVFVGLLFTPARKYVLSKWLWLGGLIAALLMLPNIIWQIQNGFPSLEFYRNATLSKNLDTSPLKVLLDQLLFTNPLATPIWLLGLGSYLFAKTNKPYRLFGWSYLILLLTMFAARSSRPDRMFAAYPVLLAAGAVVLEQLIKRVSHLRPVLATGVIVVLLSGGIALLPVSLPILPPAMTTAYIHRLGLPIQIERGHSSGLPQWLADRLDWENFVKAVADAYHSLSPEEQAQSVILARSYADAGALELLGQPYHLPPVISGHNNYYLWGPGDATGEVVISIWRHRVELQPGFQEVIPAQSFTCQYCRLFRIAAPIYICKGIKQPVHELWSLMKDYD